MRRKVDQIMARHGTDLTIVSEGEEKTVRGFFRAVQTKSWQNVENEITLLGSVSRELYSFLGPADADVKEGDSLRMGEKSYLFRRVEAYWFDNEKLYVWGLCVEKGGDDAWGAQS